jgi:transcriptional regulator with XRE-family HTH domain
LIEDVGPVVGRRRLAAELRRLRMATGKTIYDVAGAMECSAGKISRIETGAVGVRLQDVRELLDLYDVHGAKRDELLELVRTARQRPWWQDYTDVVPASSGTLFGLEAAAATIEHHTTALIPGLLQTVRYAEALIGSPSSVTTDLAKRRVELRMRRQGLLARDDGPQFTAVIGEAALREPVGGHEVMAEQLRYLMEAAERSRTTIRVRPFGAGKPAAIGSSFVIFGFADPTYGKVVYVEQLTRNTYIEEKSEVDFYVSIFADTSKDALSPDESLQLIGKIADSFS